MTERTPIRPAAGNGSAAKTWLRALDRTSRILRNPKHIFASTIDELAGQFPEQSALLSDRECLTYRALSERSNQYARWALDQALASGETVALLMPNRPEYMAIWLGITKAGGVVALLNTNLTGPSLAHCIHLVEPKHIIVAAELADGLNEALVLLSEAPRVWVHGGSSASALAIDQFLEGYGRDTLARSDRRSPTVEDRALYIYTSGTTGLPKASIISHGRIMQWTNWFAGMMDTQSGDRMYNCLPMYHSVGGVQAPGAVLCNGGSVVLRGKFSASQFWSDVVRWDCTLFPYIGELCRFLLQTERSADDTAHRVRMACGNGLRADIWTSFQKRFSIPRVLEFYAATEGTVSLFNVEGVPGSIGRTPAYLAHRSSFALVKFDVPTDAPVRNEQGFCIPCAPGETGEAIGALSENATDFNAKFEGYTVRADSEKKILRDVFHSGDSWFRTGDLMRMDRNGFFYFVDRIGDTFRWKGENVATSEVADALCEFPGVRQADVYGVEIPGMDGRAGMAAIVGSPEPDLAALRAHLEGRLPEYARPLFLRLRSELPVTSTFKYKKTDLVRQGYDPAATADAIFFNDPVRQELIPVDAALYGRIQCGQIYRRSRAANAQPLPKEARGPDGN